MQSNFSLSNKHIAIALATVGTCTVGYYLYRSRRPATKGTLKDTKSLSLDEEIANSQAKAPQTPLQRAIELKNKGNDLFKSGKYDEAITYYDQAIDQCPKDKTTDLSMFYQNRAAAYEQLRKWSAVIDDCTEALELNPKYVKALSRRARACETLKNYEQALEDITTVCILEGFQNQTTLYNTDRVLRQLGQLHAQEAFKNRVPTLPSTQFINQYFASFKRDPVLAYLDKLPEMSECDRDCSFIKAVEAIKNQDYERVLPLCEEELSELQKNNILTNGIDTNKETKPENPINHSKYHSESMLLRGTFNFLMGNYTEANKDLDALAKNDACAKEIRSNAFIKLAALNLQLERQDLTEEYYTTASKVDTENGDVYFHRAQFNAVKNDMNEAIVMYEKAIKFNKNFSSAEAQLLFAKFSLATMEMDRVRADQIVDEFKSLLERDRSSETFSLYGQILRELQRYEEADKCFEQAIEACPDNAATYVQKAVLGVQWKNDIPGAIKLIEHAIEKDKKCQFAYEILGSMEVQRGSLDRAVELFDEALKFAKTQEELAHLCSLRDAALAQKKVAQKLGLENVSLTQFM